MRIIGGTYRGKKLFTPLDGETRPTSDRVRENLFNILAHRFSFTFDKANVLDLFAGTGALGLESLSRGAAQVTFVENHPNALNILRKNASLFPQETTVVENNAFKFLNKSPTISFDLIFMDPPYREESVEKITAKILKNQWIKPGGILVIERDKKDPLPELPGLTLETSKTYGTTSLWFFSV